MASTISPSRTVTLCLTSATPTIWFISRGRRTEDSLQYPGIFQDPGKSMFIRCNPSFSHSYPFYVKAGKCEFHTSSVFFLEYIMAKNNIQIDPKKISAVAAWPISDSHKHLQRFFGFAYFYRRFIHNYSTVAALLTDLTSSKTPFHWSPAAECTFKVVKSRFTSALILQMLIRTSNLLWRWIHSMFELKAPVTS